MLPVHTVIWPFLLMQAANYRRRFIPFKRFESLSDPLSMVLFETN